jgi:hypothetical protein
MATTEIQLAKTYKNIITNAVNYYNSLIRNILNTRLPNATKNRYINTVKTQFQAYVKSVNKTYEANLIKLLKPLDPKITKNKKALLIGINYIGTPSQLNGCINDINSLKNILTTKYDFKADAETIKIITDETVQKPTRDNILAAFKQLLESGAEGDLLFFAYSGHGSNTIDSNRDEVAGGRDEMLISSDLKGIVDDELKALIQTYLKQNVTLFALFDCCFSGTVLDLKYQYLDSLDNDNFTINTNEVETNGNVIMISGCNDNQTSADAYINAKYQGAMTWALLSSLNATQTKPLSWRNLLTQMRDTLKTSQFEQLPQLSTGCFMDINKLVCF